MSLLLLSLTSQSILSSDPGPNPLQFTENRLVTNLYFTLFTFPLIFIFTHLYLILLLSSLTQFSIPSTSSSFFLSWFTQFSLLLFALIMNYPHMFLSFYIVVLLHISHFCHISRTSIMSHFTSLLLIFTKLFYIFLCIPIHCTIATLIIFSFIFLC